MSGGADAGEVRKLAVNASVYVFVTLSTRALQILLVPLYTHFLTPADFGIVSIATTLTSIVGAVASLGVAGAVTRMHHESATPLEKRQFFGLLIGFLLIVPSLIVAFLLLVGHLGWLRLGGIPFHPYLELALFAAYASCWPAVASALFVVEERPRPAALLQVLSALLQTGCMLLLVVALHQRALGAVRASLVSNIVVGAIGVAVVCRAAAVPDSLGLLWRALAFSIPLIPHSLSQWALAVSDRYLLVRWVSEGELGRYALAYQFNDILLMLAVALNSSFSPMVIRILKAGRDTATVPKLGSYVFAAVTIAALGCALFGGEAIRLFTPADYHSAAVYVPWVALGGAFFELYLVVAQGTVFSMRMRMVPVMSALATGLNIGLNLLLIPRYGALAAAITTAVAYAALALLHGSLSHRLYPIQWEFRRMGTLLVVAVACFFIGELARGTPIALRIGWKLVILVVLFPVSLKVLRLVTQAESAMISRAVRRFASRVGLAQAGGNA